MDNYSKYGLLAAGAIGLYIVAQKQGLADDTVTQSAPTDNLMGLKKTSNKRGRKRRMSKLSGTNEDIFIKLQDHSGDFGSLVKVVNAYWDNWDAIHRDGADIEFVGYNDSTGYVYIALSNGVSIASAFGRSVVYIAYDHDTEEEETFDTYKEASKA